jgi:hypothetical protein
MLELQKPHIDRQELFREAVAQDPQNDDPATLAAIYNRAVRIRGEDLERLAHTVAREGRHLTEIRGASLPYYTMPDSIARIAVTRHPRGGDIAITYRKSFQAPYDPMNESVFFESPADLEDAIGHLCERPSRGAARKGPKP